jgi:hypothetical protein
MRPNGEITPKSHWCVFEKKTVLKRAERKNLSFPICYPEVVNVGTRFIFWKVTNLKHVIIIIFRTPNGLSFNLVLRNYIKEFIRWSSRLSIYRN